MVIDGRLPEGWVLICTCEIHSFVVRRLGIAVECPRCGRLAPGADLAAEYYMRRSNERCRTREAREWRQSDHSIFALPRHRTAP